VRQAKFRARANANNSQPEGQGDRTSSKPRTFRQPRRKGEDGRKDEKDGKGTDWEKHKKVSKKSEA